MEKPDKSTMQLLIIALAMIMTLPLFYLLVTRVLLPLEWHEPQTRDAAGMSESLVQEDSTVKEKSTVKEEVSVKRSDDP